MDDLLTVRQVSILLKVHQLTVRRYINEGKLKAIKVAGNIRISRNDLAGFSESYIPHSRPTKLSSNSSTEPFTDGDPLLRLKARGLSINSLGDNNR